MSAPFRGGCYRRRIRVAASGPGVVEGGLEDDFHHFEVTLHHDGGHVVEIEARSRRWPWSTCPGAAEPLQALAGMPLSLRCLAVGDYADPRANCTHLFDLAGLAVAQAARGTEQRQYDAEVPFEVVLGQPVTVRLWRDGNPVLRWRLQGRAIMEPSPFTDAPWQGGFFRWAERTLPSLDTSEAAIVLRRACEIGLGRGMDLDAIEQAAELEGVMRGRCHTMQPSVIARAVRNKGTIRDFTDTPDDLLARGRP